MALRKMQRRVARSDEIARRDRAGHAGDVDEQVGRVGERVVARGLLDGVDFRDSALEALDGVDAAILVTEWPEFAELDWSAAAERMARPLLVDGRNFLDPNLLKSAGFEYEGIGRAVESSVPAGTTD